MGAYAVHPREGRVTEDIVAAVPPIGTIAQITGLQSALQCASGRAGGAALGTSVTQAGAGTTTPYLAYHRFLAWKYGIDIVNLGVNGNTLADMVARLSSVLALNPAFCIVEPGPNDTLQGTAMATRQAHAVTITQTLRRAGIAVVWLTETPTSAFDADSVTFNRWLGVHCREYGAQLVDVWTPLAGADGVRVAEYYLDAWHPATIGHKKMADAIDAAVAFPTIVDVPHFAGETLKQANYNFATDSNADGTADGYTAANGGATVTATLEAHDTDGNWQKVAKNASTSVQYVELSTSDLWSGLAVGDVLEIGYDLKTDDWTAPAQFLYGYWVLATAAWVPTLYNTFANATAPLTTALRVREAFTIPAGAWAHAYYKWRLGGADPSAMYVGRCSIRKRS